VRFCPTKKNAPLLQATDPGFHSHLLLSIHNRDPHEARQYGLKWSQVDSERRQLYLPKTKNGDPQGRSSEWKPLWRHSKSLRAASKDAFVFPDAESPRGWFPRSCLIGAGLKDYTWQLQSPHVRQ